VAAYHIEQRGTGVCRRITHAETWEHQ
jgi:hypothetical protein